MHGRSDYTPGKKRIVMQTDDGERYVADRKAVEFSISFAHACWMTYLRYKVPGLSWTQLGDVTTVLVREQNQRLGLHMLIQEMEPSK